MERYRPTQPATTGGLLTPGEVAALFGVDPKTVTRWARSGKLTAIRTLGGHRRYHESQVRLLLATLPQRQGGRAANRSERAADDQRLGLGSPTSDQGQTA